MQNTLTHMDGWTYNQHLDQRLVLTGWLLGGEGWECCLFVDGAFTRTLPVRRMPRPDVARNYPDRTDTTDCGYEIALTGAWDLAVSGAGQVQIAFCRSGERVPVWEKECAILLDELAHELLLFKVDELQMYYHSMLCVRGWALSQSQAEMENIYAEDEQGGRIEGSLTRTRREDVVKVLKLPPAYEDRLMGYVITLDTTMVRTRRIRIVCTDRRVSKQEIIDLKQAERDNSRMIRRCRVLSLHNRRENLRVFREGGFKGLAEYVDMQAGIVETEYEKWRRREAVSGRKLLLQRNTRFSHRPLISIVTALYNTPLPFLKALIDSMKAQSYGNWQLCLADGSDNLKIRDFIHECYRSEKRVCYRKLSQNEGISGNTNRAVEMAEGEFILFADHDDELEPDALFEIVKAINQNPQADAFYTDEDKISMNGQHYSDPALKQDFNLFLLRDNNYICHIFVVRKKLLDEVGLLEPAYDGAQDFDLILRCCEKAHAVVHIPRILYHWRCHLASTAQNPESKSYAYTAGANAVLAHYRRMGIRAEVEQASLLGMRLYGHYHSIVEITGSPLVSIIIPTRDHVEDLRTCISSILEKTTWPDYEILVIDNGSRMEDALSYMEELSRQQSRVRILKDDRPFNFSSLNNAAVNEARGDILCFLNNDTRVLTPGWIQEMLMICQQPDVGAVGAKLYYPDGHIQHAGVILGLGGVAGHLYSSCKGNETGMMGRAVSVQELSAVTAACMMSRREVFLEVGGFDEAFAVAYNDIDYCMRLRKAGYRVVFTPYAQLTHYELKTRGKEDTPQQMERFKKEEALFRSRWQASLDAGDPFYHPLMTLDNSKGLLRGYKVPEDEPEDETGFDPEEWV